MTDSFELEVTQSEPGIRLDTWIHRQLPQLSRTALCRLIDEKQITVNGRFAKARYTPKIGESIRVTIPPAKSCEIEPEAISLIVLFEDEHLLVLDKAPGICVHPSAGHPNGTLVNALLHHCQGQLSGIGGISRPGIVHRLDQDTSGCIVVAKDDATHQGLAEQFAARTVSKSYLAITCGSVRPKEGDIKANITRHPSHRKRMAVTDGSGREAHTGYTLIEDYSLASLVEARLYTGRTHQIRVHLKHIGFPVFGDDPYGNRQTKRLASTIRFTPARQMLHAQKLSFQHPITKNTLKTEAPIPTDMSATIKCLKKFREANVID
jgi:23S rRNA pseudouridine1911/1915/1917 synthase